MSACAAPARQLPALTRAAPPPRPTTASGSVSATASEAAPSSGSTLSDARVEDAVHDIHQQVDEDVHQRDDQHDTLNQRVVAPSDRLNQEAADAGDVEDLLGDDG